MELSAGRCGPLARLGTPLAWRSTTTSWASNSKSLSAAFSTRRLTRKPLGTMRQAHRQLVHPMLSPGGPGYDRRRLTSVPWPGLREPATSTHRMLYCCRTSPALPEAGETTSRAGQGYPTARTPGSGRCLITRTGAVNLNLTRGQHDYGKSRLVDSEWTGSPT